MFGLDGPHENKNARELSVARTKKVLSIELLFFTDSCPGYESRVFDGYADKPLFSTSSIAATKRSNSSKLE